jgi:hypothetical protein
MMCSARLRRPRAEVLPDVSVELQAARIGFALLEGADDSWGNLHRCRPASFRLRISAATAFSVLPNTTLQGIPSGLLAAILTN